MDSVEEDIEDYISQFFNFSFESTHPFLDACGDSKTPFQLMYFGSLVCCFVIILFVHMDALGHTGRIIFWILMFLLFMMQFYNDWLNLNDAVETMTSPWDIFNCYARIVVNSPNFKWTVCSTLCSISGEAFASPEASSHINFSDAFNGKKLLQRLKDDPVTEIFLIAPLIITSLMTVPFSVSHIVWAQIEYCWFTMLMWMSSDLCITCGECCCKQKQKYDKDGNPIKKTRLQTVLTVIFLLWQLGCYSLVYYIGIVLPVNFYSLHGWPMSANYTVTYDNDTSSYLEAVFETFNSRNLAEYNENMFFGANATNLQKIEYFWVIL